MQFNGFQVRLRLVKLINLLRSLDILDACHEDMAFVELCAQSSNCRLGNLFVCLLEIEGRHLFEIDGLEITIFLRFL